MKKHAIIPIFIPHRGCPNDCVFCNQRKITARTDDIRPEDVRSIVEQWLTTLDSVQTVEIAFYGGSFTGLPIAEQSAFLAVAHEYKTAGKVDKIHLSTRPDYIDEEILDNLSSYEVDTIELGVQSFDNAVLKASNRGHDKSSVYRAVNLIKARGFELGIQLMIGLPGDSFESCIMSATEAAALKPDLARLYPTIILDDTELYNMYTRGEYTPLSREEAIERTKEMYKILDTNGVNIMRVGLKSTEIIGEGGAINGGTYHPAFRQLVESAITREKIEPQLKAISESKGSNGTPGVSDPQNTSTNCTPVTIFSNRRSFSNMIGNASENKIRFQNMFPNLVLTFSEDNSLADGDFRIEEI